LVWLFKCISLSLSGLLFNSFFETMSLLSSCSHLSYVPLCVTPNSIVTFYIARYFWELSFLDLCMLSFSLSCLMAPSTLSLLCMYLILSLLQSPSPSIPEFISASLWLFMSITSLSLSISSSLTDSRSYPHISTAPPQNRVSSLIHTSMLCFPIPKSFRVVRQNWWGLSIGEGHTWLEQHGRKFGGILGIFTSSSNCAHPGPTYPCPERWGQWYQWDLS
jgi:hypothetical protein